MTGVPQEGSTEFGQERADRLTNPSQGSGADYGQTRADLLTEGEPLIEDDKAPEEYQKRRGEKEADIVYTGHIYPAVVTAHFPDRASGQRALAALEPYNFAEPDAIQWFEKEAPDARGDVNDAGLAPGETAIIVQLEDESVADEIVRLFEGAGAKHARFYPHQQIGQVAPDKR